MSVFRDHIPVLARGFLRKPVSLHKTDVSQAVFGDVEVKVQVGVFTGKHLCFQKLRFLVAHEHHGRAVLNRCHVEQGGAPFGERAQQDLRHRVLVRFPHPPDVLDALGLAIAFRIEKHGVGDGFEEKSEVLHEGVEVVEDADDSVPRVQLANRPAETQFVEAADCAEQLSCVYFFKKRLKGRFRGRQLVIQTKKLMFSKSFEIASTVI